METWQDIVVWLGIGAVALLIAFQSIVLRERGNTIRNLRSALTKEYREHDREMQRLEERAGINWEMYRKENHLRSYPASGAWTEPGGTASVEIGPGGASGPAGDPFGGSHPDPRLNKHSTMPAFYGQPEPSENPDRGRTHQRLDPSPMSAPEVPVHAVGDKAQNYTFHEIGFIDDKYVDRVVGPDGGWFKGSKP